MFPYYILKSNKFDIDIHSYKTPSQIGFDNIRDNSPITSFTKNNNQSLDGFIKYDLVCETEQRKKGRAYGNDIIFDRFILINENKFYYDYNNQTIILASDKYVFNKFFKDMKGNDKFSFDKIEVNFEEIVKNIKALGIEGVWMGEIPNDINVTTLSMFGCNVEDSEKYNELLKQGAKIKNLSLIYNYKDNQERIMITRDGGIILYNSMDESDALSLVKDVYLNMFFSIPKSE